MRDKRLRIVAGVLLAAASSACHSPLISGTATSAAVPVPPPAVSGIDNTVSVTISLADSFDFLPHGKCAGRSSNSGMRDDARVQLRGDTVGGSTWATATAHAEFHPVIYRGKLVPEADDGHYCVLKAVFAPTTPDPESRYSIKFVGGDWRQGLVHVGRAPYGQRDRPGYGRAQVTIQTCRSPADPPDKDCPEWAE